MSHATPAKEARHHSRDVDLDVVLDELLFTEDFGSWHGKSIFESILAEVVHQEHLGHPTLSLGGVLELVEALYARAITEARIDQGRSQPNHLSFYSYIYSARCQSSVAEWQRFCQKLSSRISTSCKRLRNNRILDFHAASMPRRAQNSAAPTRRMDDSSGSNRFSGSSSDSSLHATSSSISETHTVRPQAQRLSSALPNLTEPQNVIEMHRYTSFLQEHSEIIGECLGYEKEKLSSTPSRFRCVATLGGRSAEGEGRNGQQAKHAASKHMCALLELSVV